VAHRLTDTESPPRTACLRSSRDKDPARLQPTGQEHLASIENPPSVEMLSPANMR